MTNQDWIKEERNTIYDWLSEGHKVLAIQTYLNYEDFLFNYSGFISDNYYKDFAFEYYDKSTSYWKCKYGPLFIPVSEDDVKKYGIQNINTDIYDLEESIGWIMDDVNDCNGHLSANSDFYSNSTSSGDYILPDLKDYNIIVLLTIDDWFCSKNHLKKLMELLIKKKNLKTSDVKIIKTLGNKA